MRIILALIVLLATGTAGANDSSAAQVCFVRHGNNGLMNSLPVRIYGSRGSRDELLTTLVGDTRKCVAVEVGSWSFEARSSRPYAVRAGDPNACKSEPLSVEVGTPTTTIEVAPKSKRSTYLCGWDLRLKEDAAQHGVAPDDRPRTAARR
jgi:hypothetical protein